MPKFLDDIKFIDSEGKERVVSEYVPNNLVNRVIDLENFDDNHNNIENGEGVDSIVLRYTGKVDDTHFGNKDYVLDDNGNPVKDKTGSILYGESAAIFGEANSNNANRALLAGYNNINSGEDSIQTGTSNKNYGIGSAEFGSQNINRGHYSALIGSGLRNEQQKEDGTYNTKVIVGKWNLDRLDNIFEVGNGENDKERSNAFEVLRDGRAKVKTAPKEDDDVVRKLELDGKISISDINQAFFNSLYNWKED